MDRLHANDHDFGGLDERGGGVALLETHFSNRIRGDNGGDALAADGEGDLGHQAADLDVQDAADELIAPADATKIGSSLLNRTVFLDAVEEFVNFGFGDTVMAPRRLHRAQLAFIDPLFERGIADAENLRGIARREQLGTIHWRD